MLKIQWQISTKFDADLTNAGLLKLQAVKQGGPAFLAYAICLMHSTLKC